MAVVTSDEEKKVGVVTTTIANKCRPTIHGIATKLSPGGREEKAQPSPCVLLGYARFTLGPGSHGCQVSGERRQNGNDVTQRRGTVSGGRHTPCHPKDLDQPEKRSCPACTSRCSSPWQNAINLTRLDLERDERARAHQNATSC